MNGLILALLVVGAQAEDRALAPQEPQFVDAGVLPPDGAEGVPLDVHVWTGDGSFPQLVGPEGDMNLVQERGIFGNVSLQSFRPTAGLEPNTRYTILGGFNQSASTTFTTGEALTSTPPEAPEMRAQDERFVEGGGRILRFTMAFDGVLLVNPNPEDATVTNVTTATQASFLELPVQAEGEVRTAFATLNAAGMVSEIFVHEQPAPVGCAQWSGEPLWLFGLALLALGRRRRS